MKKIICAVMAVVMLMTVLCVPAFAADNKTVVNGSLYGTSYYYRDSYFAADASIYNPSLSTMSAVLADSGNAESGDNWTHQYRTLFSVFNALGFTDCDVNDDFKVYPTTDSMGVAMAHKTITVSGQTYTLLAIVPRGNYMAEWANNFSLGTSGNASGFAGSAAKVEAFIQTYTEQYGANFVGDLKVWIVGYSRGAAVANLVAGHLTHAGKVGNRNVAKENIYAYTFETPKGLCSDVVSAAEAKTYTNIHNIITANDFVTKVAPQDWNFIRYGTDESVIPSERTAANESLFNTALSFAPSYLKTVTSAGKTIFLSEQFRAKQFTSDITAIARLGSWTQQDGIYVWTPVGGEEALAALTVDSDKSMGDFLDDLITAMATGIGSRVNYTYFVQDTIRLYMSETMGGNYQTQTLETAKAVLSEQLKANEASIVVAAATGNLPYLENILTGIADTVLTTSGMDAGAYAAVPAQVLALIPILAQTMVADALIDGGSDILTLIENFDILFYPHYAGQFMAWLMAQDVNYNPGAVQNSAAVTNVNVTVEKYTETVKILFIKTKVTKYRVTITPVSDAPVQKVEYKTTLLDRGTTGTTFTRDINCTYLNIAVTDANGNVTHWEYRNGKVKQA